MSIIVSDNLMRRVIYHYLVRVSSFANRNRRQRSEASETLRAQKRKGRQKGQGPYFNREEHRWEKEPPLWDGWYGILSRS